MNTLENYLCRDVAKIIMDYVYPNYGVSDESYLKEIIIRKRTAYDETWYGAELEFLSDGYHNYLEKVLDGVYLYQLDSNMEMLEGGIFYKGKVMNYRDFGDYHMRFYKNKKN